MEEIASQIPPEDIISVQSCRKPAQEYSRIIFKLWKAINTILTFHEARIRKHWLKKSKAQKQNLLLKAWPNMSSRYRPDIERRLSGRDANLTIAEAQEEEYPEFKWPYINLEDLLRPKALLIFVNSRGHHHPDEFAYSDLELAPIFKLRKEFLANRQENVTMAFIGRRSPETYGEVMEWNMHQLLPSRFRPNYQYLSIMVSRSWRSRKVYGPFWVELPLLTTDESNITSPDVVARDAPYRLPSILDLSRLQAHASAQKSQAVDHVMALREDPGHFAEVTECYRAHWSELLLDAQGRPHPHAKDYPVYNKAQRQMTQDAHCLVFLWHEIHARIMKLRQISSQYAQQITVGNDLQSSYLDAMAETRSFLEQASLDLISIVKTEFLPYPPLRGYHHRANPNDTNLHVFHIEQLPGIDVDNKILIHVLGLIHVLSDNGWRDLLSLHVILDEFERLMQDEPRAKALITPHIATTLSQLSIISECLQQLHRYQPLASKVESIMQQRKFQYMAQYDHLFRKWGQINKVTSWFNSRPLFRVGNSKYGRFYYPAEERRTRETTTAMISAEAALDTFWKTAEIHWTRHTGTTPMALISHIVGERGVQRTVPWSEPANNSSSALVQYRPLLDLTPFSGHLHDASKQITSNFSKLAVAVKNKEKTRQIPTGEVEVAIDPNVAQAVDPVESTIAVDKQIVWPDFLHAMVKAGFGAEKLQRSAWHFAPKDLDIERSIQFHEPHPGNKLPFTWARRYGRRLNQAFGWSRESFELA
ncbi:hypothetical protein CC86DRAFT_410896 [Ophiobolus disseminans]|uniref:Uncharacterized protein n=1 Tax=Ophiobolus disseminans TaxID=1469910 RepID=A0A6A6ZNI4_9PLEO|nr:hypothetical protein CC86DRAFT_410896 [Ophiobolus disseminans]